MIQEHFDAFNAPWTRELVTWHPEVDPATGHLSLPEGPGLGIDLNLAAIEAHPYDPGAYLNVHAEGWQKRLGQGALSVQPWAQCSPTASPGTSTQ